MVDILFCETCGEAEQEISLAEAGLCGDCFASQMSQVLAETIGDKFCCHPLFASGRLAGMCMIPHGMEHAHGKIECLEIAARD